MAKSVRWIIVAGAVLFVFLAVIVLLQKIEKNKVVSSVRQIVSNYDKSAKLKYEKFEVEGFFKPKAITCYKCKIQSNKLDLSVDKLHIKISENHKYDITLKDAIYTKGDFNSKQTTFSYKLASKEDVKITYRGSSANVNYSITIPQIISFISPYNSYVIKYNDSQTPLSFHIKDKILQSFQYEDSGLNIYEKQDKDVLDDSNHISTTAKNIFNISTEKREDNQVFNIYIKSNDNKLVNKTDVPNKLKNSFFAVFLDAKYYDSSDASSGYQKNLIIRSFDFDFPNIKFHLDGNLIQDKINLVPYGKLNLTIDNYKEFLSNFYDSIAAESLPENTPNLLRSMQENTEDKKMKALIFLERLNNSNSDILTVNIARQSAGFPFINNLSFDEITKLYHQIYGPPKTGKKDGNIDPEINGADPEIVPNTQEDEKILNEPTGLR